MTEHDDYTGTTTTLDGTETVDGTVLLAGDTPEPWSYDVDGDGQDDVVQWSFDDGTWQQLVDVDADGKADVLLIDVNGDDNADIQIWDNGDGTYTAAQDADGDGTFETEETFSRTDLDAALPGIADLLDSTFGAGTADPDQPADPTAPTGEEPTGEQPTDEQPTGDEPTGDNVPIEHDVDGDGIVDAVEWQFGDGTWQTVVDIDGDAQADVMLLDTDGDGLADLQILENGDGTYTVLQDADGDSVFDAEQTFTRAELDDVLPGVTEALDLTFGTHGPAEPDEPTEPTDPGAPVSDGDAVVLDTDGDGVVDTIAWDFGDGTWQELRDVDGDGNADVLVIDTDADDFGNYGIVDNGDGTYTVFADSDNDGEWDSETSTLTRAELDEVLPGVPDLLDARVDGSQPTAPGPEPTGPGAEPVDNPAENPSDDSGSVGPVAYDGDGDGTVDILQWSYPDGTWEQVVDLDADANPDVVLIDTDGDATANLAIWENGDGTYTLAQDADGDGEFETERTMTRGELDDAVPGLTELLDTPLTGDPVA